MLTLFSVGKNNYNLGFTIYNYNYNLQYISVYITVTANRKRVSFP